MFHYPRHGPWRHPLLESRAVDNLGVWLSAESRRERPAGAGGQLVPVLPGTLAFVTLLTILDCLPQRQGQLI